MKFNLQFVVVLFFGAMIALLSLLAYGTAPDSLAAPAIAPTPVANLDAGSAEPAFWRFQTATALTADTNTSGREIIDFESVDIQLTIDQGTVNTTTVTIQYSNDNSNWDDGVALVSSNAADVTEMTRVPAFGRYMRIKQDVTNSNPITITILAVGR